MKKYTYVLLSIIVILVSFPFVKYQLKETSYLNVWIIDKTVPTNDFREHKGFVWLLNNMKIKNKLTMKYFDYTKDYFGFYPKKDGYDIFDIKANNPDFIYIADTYGVYTDDLNKQNVQGTKSNLIYGGLNEEELYKIKSYLNNGRTIVAEFNTIQYPTSEKVRNESEGIFGFKWRGWIGRYFTDLSKDVEVPTWVIKAYEEQYKAKWEFKGNGFVYISKNNEILVLDKNDFKSKKMYIDFKDEYEDEYNVVDKVNYNYWFEVNEVNGAEVLADFKIDLNEEGLKKISKYGLRESFPAVLRKNTGDYKSYYFAGDFVDIRNIPIIYQMAGYDKFMKLISRNTDTSQGPFFGRCMFQ